MAAGISRRITRGIGMARKFKADEIKQIEEIVKKVLDESAKDASKKAILKKARLETGVPIDDK